MNITGVRVMTRYELDHSKCGRDGCDHTSTDHEMVLAANCHRGSSVYPEFTGSLLCLRCGECGKPIIALRLSETVDTHTLPGVDYKDYRYIEAVYMNGDVYITGDKDALTKDVLMHYPLYSGDERTRLQWISAIPSLN